MREEWDKEELTNEQMSRLQAACPSWCRAGASVKAPDGRVGKLWTLWWRKGKVYIDLDGGGGGIIDLVEMFATWVPENTL